VRNFGNFLMPKSKSSGLGFKQGGGSLLYVEHSNNGMVMSPYPSLLGNKVATGMVMSSAHRYCVVARG
jgi:hypothetical protein